jgi:hypothetical protein
VSGGILIESLQQWTASFMDDEDFLQITANDAEREGQIRLLQTKLFEGLEMDHSSILTCLEEFPSVKEKFLSLGSHVREEIAEYRGQISGTSGSLAFSMSEKRNPDDAYDTFSVARLNITEGGFEGSFRDIELRSAEITRDLEEEGMKRLFLPQNVELSGTNQQQVSNSKHTFLPATFFFHTCSLPSFLLHSLDFIVKSNLHKMLETVQESCESNISGLDDSQDFLDLLISPLESLSGFSVKISEISSTSTSLSSDITEFWKIAKSLAKVAYGPLAPLKGIVSGMKYPMNILLTWVRHWKRGKERFKISTLKSTAN